MQYMYNDCTRQLVTLPSLAGLVSGQYMVTFKAIPRNVTVIKLRCY